MKNKFLYTLAACFGLLAGAASCSDSSTDESSDSQILPPPAEEQHFAISTSDLTSATVTIKIDFKNSDEYAYFTWNLMTSEDYRTRYASPEELIDEELKELIEVQLPDYQAYVDPDGTLIDILSRISDSQKITGLKEQTEYTVYAFGVGPEGEATTALETYTFTTPAWEAVDACTFDITFPEEDIEQLQFSFTVTPSNEQTRYYVGLVDTAEIDASSPEEVAAEFIRRANIAEVDWSTSKTLRQGVQTLHTYNDMEIADLEPDTDYSIVVFGMSSLGERTTAVAYETVRTLPVPQSDMTFDIKVLEELDGGVRIQFTPSVDNETYYAGTIRKDQYDAYVGRDEEFMNYVVTTAGLGLQQGAYLLERPEGALSVDRDYVYFAFGYIGGITTGLTTGTFHTKASDVSKASVSFDFSKEAIDGGKIRITANITPNEYAAHWYVQPWKSSDGETIGSIFVTMEDSDLLNDLMNNKPYPDITTKSVDIDEGQYAAFCAVAVDANGKYGEMVKIFVKAEE